ncbi:TetR/AcrR family transcriptional regulator [Halobacillus locisalis]|uniref:TetR/AcrR family transcriptional regulator n=1 Tax=Halobacillus locisalis TaxID=220753 RepID=A0A838CWV8_9BACI|nr:TetR/AcrR family transcriptional regulator [Halobacillus locisalis]MBA2176403.1 TetR/AcrR family transcriptional regulator [Halobacillus locisalis]
MKEKILNTSTELFGKRGFQETSIQDIVSSNQLTKGTFYYYFKNKEDVLVHIHEQFIDSLLAQQNEIMAEGRTAHDQLRSMVRMLIGNIRTNANSAMVFFREMRHLSQAKTDDILPKRHLFQRNIASVIEQGIQLGEFRSDLRADMLSFAVLGIANWSYFWYEPDGEVGEEELTTIFMEMIFKGIEEENHDN